MRGLEPDLAPRVGARFSGGGGASLGVPVYTLSPAPLEESAAVVAAVRAAVVAASNTSATPVVGASDVIGAAIAAALASISAVSTVPTVRTRMVTKVTKVAKVTKVWRGRGLVP
jgi:hypothetical protein